MRSRSPFDRCSNSAQKRVLVTAFGLSAALLIAMQALDVPLKTPDAPHGIVSFELAKDIDASRKILNSWNARAKTHAGLSLGLDFIFLIVYAIFVSLACVQIGKALQGRSSLLAAVGGALAWAQFLAAIFDIVENLALIALLLNSERLWLPTVARTSAIIKFSIVSAGLIYIGGGLLIIGLEKLFEERL